MSYLIVAIIALARMRLIRGYRVERYSHHLAVNRREGVWSPVRSTRDLMPEELEALRREGFDFRHALHHPLLQVNSVIGGMAKLWAILVEVPPAETKRRNVVFRFFIVCIAYMTF